MSVIWSVDKGRKLPATDPLTSGRQLLTAFKKMKKKLKSKPRHKTDDFGRIKKKKKKEDRRDECRTGGVARGPPTREEGKNKIKMRDYGEQPQPLQLVSNANV